ncbi:hypothetical protein BpHYR1_006826 [Brachionus plicatilis]|uniref:Uncharacterized protein n=1 Tax=Brachionus plicatilis TaxID=10195 RepID=A0A3M7RS19_BRAPC|nr:hypothetical protein BpHYR1_006826 [Brachionus plicatilis]
MRQLYQNFDINCSIFSRSVSGKKSALNACIKIQNSENKCRIRGQGITFIKWNPKLKQVIWVLTYIPLNNKEAISL